MPQQPAILVTTLAARLLLLAPSPGKAATVAVRVVSERSGAGVQSNLWIVRQETHEAVEVRTGADGVATVSDLSCGSKLFIQAIPLAGHQHGTRTCYYAKNVIVTVPPAP